ARHPRTPPHPRRDRPRLADALPPRRRTRLPALGRAPRPGPHALLPHRTRPPAAAQHRPAGKPLRVRGRDRPLRLVRRLDCPGARPRPRHRLHLPAPPPRRARGAGPARSGGDHVRGPAQLRRGPRADRGVPARRDRRGRHSRAPLRRVPRDRHRHHRRAGPARRRAVPAPPLPRHPPRPHLTATYYRSLYQGDMRRVVAREHSSLLTTEDRLEYETSFKNSEQRPGTPNVLVATPTLEMGIDIGDLSTVLLASVPRTVASYLQRVGRAGRQTGNALDVTFVAGRGRAAGLYYDPLDLLNGTVRAPGAYLSAQEILRRQLLASILDTLAGDDRITPPA